MVMAELTFSRGDIADVAQVPNDVLTFWLRQGLIVPLTAPGGTGRHLRFKKYEAKIAAFLAQGRLAGLNVEALRALASAVRSAFAWIEENGVTRADWEPITDEMSRLAWEKHGGEFAHLAGNTAAKRIIALLGSLAEKEAEARELILALLINEGMVGLYRSQGSDWQIGLMHSVEEGLPHPFCIMFDLALILGKLVWTREIGR